MVQAREEEVAKMGMMSPPSATPAHGAAQSTKEASAVKIAALPITKTPTAAGAAVTATPTTAKPANTSTIGRQTARAGMPATGGPAAAGGCSAVAAGDGSASAVPRAGAGRLSLTGPLAQLPFEGLSQALSQGSLEWVDGLIVPPGCSQDETAGASTAQPNTVAPEGTHGTPPANLV